MEPQSKLGLIQQLGLSGVCAQWGNGLPVQEEEYQLAAKYAKMLAAIVTGEMNARYSCWLQICNLQSSSYLLSLAQPPYCHCHNLPGRHCHNLSAAIGTTSSLSLSQPLCCQCHNLSGLIPTTSCCHKHNLLAASAQPPCNHCHK